MIKKYRVIAKVGNDKFVRYKVNDLLKFKSFLDRNWRDWRWFNVYEYRKGEKGRQIANFTKHSPPLSKWIHV